MKKTKIFKSVLYKLPVVLFFLSFILVFRIYLTEGVPYTHDGQNHLARFANYKIALREGQFPPRWAPNLLNRYGYPVFNFNYPLANIVSLPFSVLGISYNFTFKLIVVFAVLFGVAGLNQWLNLLNLKSNRVKFLALSSFLLNPYLINLVYFRGSIGEILALSILIWLFYLIELIKLNDNQTNSFKIFFLGSLLFTLFNLSHNVMVLFGTLCLLFYALLRKYSLNKWLVLFRSLLTGLGLSLWFWLPAMMEKGETILGQAELSLAFQEHFPTLNQLFFSPLGFGFSYTSPIDNLSFSLGWILVATSFLFGCYLIAKRVSKQAINLKKSFNCLFLILLALVFFQISITSEIWQIVPMANFIQFPWRLSLLIAVISPVIVAQMVSKNVLIYLTAILVVCWQLITISKLSPADYVNLSNLDYDAFAETTSTAHENLSKDFTYKNIHDWQPSAELIEGGGDVSVTYWTGSSREYHLNLTKKSVIVEPTMNFSGWKTWANNELVNYEDSTEIGGRIAYVLEPGKYSVVTRFTQDTPARKIGNTVSIIVFLIISIIAASKIKKKFYVFKFSKK